MSLSCIIIDDEPNAVDLLEILIRQTSSWDLKAKCYDAIEAMTFLKTQSVDFIFLDINMPQLSGMELASLLPSDTRIVFTTAYSEYAADSYSFNTIDYLLKPVTLKRFLSAMQKIETHFLPVQPSVAVAATQNNNEYFFVRSGKTLHKILLSDILYFEGEREYIRLVSSETQILIYRRLKEVQEQLDLPFLRIHNSYIVNTERLDKIQDNHVFMAGKQIPISEKFRNKFMMLINERLF